jgi:hypothetical protein
MNESDKPVAGKEGVTLKRSPFEEERRQVVKEYADGLREIIQKLREILH